MKQLLADAHAVEDAGAFAVVLEMVPSEAAARVTQELRIPTIGVGAGPHVDGTAVGVDRLGGLHEGSHPEVREAVRELAQEPHGCRHRLSR